EAVAAVQAVLRLDRIGLARRDAALRAVGRAAPAADAGIGDAVTLRRGLPAVDRVGLAEDRPHAEVEILDRRLPDHKDDADIAGVAGVDVRKIGLLREDRLNPARLFLLRDGHGAAAQPDHLFIA